mgnify:CR=1 FL=1
MRAGLIAGVLALVMLQSLGCNGVVEAPSPRAEPTEPSAPGVESGPMALADLQAFNDIIIRSGELAHERGNTESVRDYGRMLVSDHHLVEEWVEQVATEANYDLDAFEERAEENVEPMRSGLQQLEDLEDAAFTRQFLTAMEQWHETMLEDLSQQLPQIRNESARELVARIQPILQEHEERADKLLMLQQEEAPRVGRFGRGR